MRVLRSKTPFLPYVLHVLTFSELKTAENQQLENIGAENVPVEPISEAFNSLLFKHIKPGRERVAIILRAEGMNQREIAWTMGIQIKDVNTILWRIRRRLDKMRQKTASSRNLTNNPYHL